LRFTFTFLLPIPLGIPIPKPKKKRGRKGKSAGMSSDDEEAEVEGIVEGADRGQTATDGDEPASPKPKPKARPKPRMTKRKSAAADDDDADVFGPVGIPKARSPSKRQAAKKVPIREVGSDGPDDEVVAPTLNGHNSSPKVASSLKRRREADGSELSDIDGQENIDPAREASPAQSHVSVADVKNRRKRARR